jgi:hypothetical protein
MDHNQLQSDKLHLINWITQIQDYTLIEKIKSLMSTSNENLALTKEQELILAVENGTEISTPINDDELSTNYEL